MSSYAPLQSTTVARKIPDALVGEVLSRSANGEGTRKIAAWLEEAHGISVHFTGVADLLKDSRAERKEAAQAIVAEKLGSADGLSADIDGIIALRKEAAEVRAIALREVQAEPTARAIGAWATAAKEYRETTKLALEIAGLAKPDDHSATDDAAAQVVGRIAGLLAAAGGDPSEPNEG